MCYYLPMKDRITLQTGAQPTKEELMTAYFIIKYDKNVKIRFLAASQAKGARTPDIEMNGLKWEIKRPTSNSKYTVQHAFKAAVKQSPNVIFDLRCSKLHQENALNRLIHEFNLSRAVKRLLIITKSKKILDYNK